MSKKNNSYQKCMLEGKVETFTFPLDFKPENIVLDYNYWAVMEVGFNNK